MEVDGESYKSWAWWFDALQAMRRTYSIPMDAKEARIRADVEEARREETAAALRLAAEEALRKDQLMRLISKTKDPEALRAAAEEAHRKDWVKEEHMAVDRWAKTKDPQAAEYQKQLIAKQLEKYRMMDRERSDDDGDVDWSEEAEVPEYRRKWNFFNAKCHGTYDDTTGIPAMRFTDNRDRNLHPTGTLQVFSFKVTRIAEELRWPLNVYGLIAIRDHLDRNRNIIFARSRDNCQTITSQDPYLTLTGPTRAAVLSETSDTVRFEVVLKVKSATDVSQDKDLSLLATKYRRFDNRSCVINLAATSRLSKLEWTVGYLDKSVEATINIQVIYGKWPLGCRGIFSASTNSLDDMKLLLLSLEDDKLPVNTDGIINLSRNVACAEIDGELKISVATEYADGEHVSTAEDETVFTPRKHGRSCAILKVRTCEMKVVVAWSLVCSY